MNKFHFLILLIYSIFFSSTIPCVNGKTSLDTIFNDTTEKSFNNGLSVSSTVKNKKIDYEQIDYFYDLWINTYFKKKNFEITCDNIMNHLASKKDKLNALNNNKEYSLKQDFKYKKTYDICHYFEKYIKPTTISGFNETIIDKDIYDSTAEYLYYVWIALSNPSLKKLINYDFMDNIKCPIRDLFVMSLIPYTLLLVFGIIFLLVRRHYNRAINQLRQKLSQQHLSQQQLNRLRTKVLTNRDIDLLNANCNNGFHELCGICREVYRSNERIRILNCKHIFHQECIDNWLLYYNNICPYCKSDISKNTDC